MSTWSWCFGRSSYSYRSPFHWVSQFFDKLNLRSWSVPATPFVRAQWSSWRLTPGTVVQWRCDTSTHRHGVTWVMHRSHRCRCLDVPLFERGYGKECFFCCAPPSSADWWCIYCTSLEDPADIAKNAIAHAKSNGCVLDFRCFSPCMHWMSHCFHCFWGHDVVLVDTAGRMQAHRSTRVGGWGNKTGNGRDPNSLLQG